MSGRFRFADFELDVDAYALRRADQRVKLERIPMEMLILLVTQAGALVPRGDIRASLWDPDVFVDHDAAISTAIRKIRQALGDDAEKPRFVETVVGKGYRFIAPVRGPRSLAHTWRPFRLTRGKREFILDTGENVLGRDPDAGVYVEDASVSRRHARVVIGPGEAILEDLNSRNGTFLNGRRIDGPAPLGNGAVIGLGLVTLTFRVRAAPASTRPVKT